MTKSSTSAKPTRGRQKAKSSNIGLWIVGVSIAVVVGVVALAAFNNRPAKTVITSPDVSAEWIARSTMGSPDASITVQAWEDYLCSHCLEWTEQVEPKLLADYVKPGLVKYEFHPFPLDGFMPGSLMAALASECAADQGKFWEYHDRLFQAQSEGQAGYTIDKLAAYAEQLGMDRDALVQCVSSQQHQSEVQASYQQGVALGIGGTPSIFVNGKQVGATYDALKAEIDALLAASGDSN